MRSGVDVDGPRVATILVRRSTGMGILSRKKQRKRYGTTRCERAGIMNATYPDQACPHRENRHRPDSFGKHFRAGRGRGHRARRESRLPGAQTVCVPMADGGEGTVEAVLAATSGEARMQTVNDALGHKVDAAWGMLADGTAVIEMAAASGLELIAPARRDPMRASSHGVGELILAALDAGARHIILAGRLRHQRRRRRHADAARGCWMPKDTACRPAAARWRGSPPSISADSTPGCPARASTWPATWTIRSAARKAHHTFSVRKGRNARAGAGAGPGAGTLCRHLRAQPGVDHRDAPGAGAAGGLGFAVKAFLGARFRPGVDIVAELGGLAQAVEGATLVFTGEGRMDAQTLRGKTPAGVARIARQAGVPVVALAGSLGEGYEACTPAASARRSASRPAPSRCSRRSTTPNACCTIARAT